MRRTDVAVIGKRTLIAAVASLILLGAVAPAFAQPQAVTVQGRVQWIAGEKMMLIPNDGSLPIEVDLKQTPQGDYMTLAEGDQVVVQGVAAPQGRTLIAASVRPAGG